MKYQKVLWKMHQGKLRRDLNKWAKFEERVLLFLLVPLLGPDFFFLDSRTAAALQCQLFSVPLFTVKLSLEVLSLLLRSSPSAVFSYTLWIFFLSLGILMFCVTVMWALLAMTQSSNSFTFETFNPLASLWGKEEEECCLVNSTRKLEIDSSA